MDSKKFSIIIPAYAEEENIPRLLNDIDTIFVNDKNIEIVLVDDGSPVSLNGLIEYKKYGFDIKVISNKYNLGQSKSIEVGLKNSTGEIFRNY